MFEVIEDCSPYYIRFKHVGIDTIINQCLDYVKDVKFDGPFNHHVFPLQQAAKLISLNPAHKFLNFDMKRVSLFVSQPGYRDPVHKDGPDHRISINYTVKVLDNKCVTSWYEEEDLKDYPLVGDLYFSRELDIQNRENIRKLKSMTAQQGELILFNTDIFHDWDNRLAENERMVLTFRVRDPGKWYFDYVKKLYMGV